MFVDLNLTEGQAIFHEMNLPAAGWMSAKVIVRQWWRGSGVSGYGPTWSCARCPWYSRRSNNAVRRESLVKARSERRRCKPRCKHLFCRSGKRNKTKALAKPQAEGWRRRPVAEQLGRNDRFVMQLLAGICGIRNRFT
ncbi:hypothetical protein [Sinorhizobium medicae]|uniref:hypothetical protein n=1 Tax=Sinorhizobium medicae TaxID=110321 RepID=UPI0011B5F8B1|nr:hypothetical protein [Sinorhizobium medicae]